MGRRRGWVEAGDCESFDPASELVDEYRREGKKARWRCRECEVGADEGPADGPAPLR